MNRNSVPVRKYQKSSIHVFLISEEEKKDWHRKIMVKKLSIFGEGHKFTESGSSRDSREYNTKKVMPRHSEIKLIKTKDEAKLLKEARKK